MPDSAVSTAAVESNATQDGARLIDGVALAKKVRDEVAADVTALRARGVIPNLTVVLVGETLLAGNVVEGPPIVTQFDSTSVVPPGFTCTVDPVGNLVITYSEAVQQAAERGH